MENMTEEEKAEQEKKFRVSVKAFMFNKLLSRVLSMYSTGNLED